MSPSNSPLPLQLRPIQSAVSLLGLPPPPYFTFSFFVLCLPVPLALDVFPALSHQRHNYKVFPCPAVLGEHIRELIGSDSAFTRADISGLPKSQHT